MLIQLCIPLLLAVIASVVCPIDALSILSNNFNNLPTVGSLIRPIVAHHPIPSPSNGKVSDGI